MDSQNANTELAMLFTSLNAKAGQSPSELKTMYIEAIHELNKYDKENMKDFTL